MAAALPVLVVVADDWVPAGRHAVASKALGDFIRAVWPAPAIATEDRTMSKKPKGPRKDC